MGLENLQTASENLKEVEACYKSDPDKAKIFLIETNGALKAFCRGLEADQEPDGPTQETLKKEIEERKNDTRSEFSALLMSRNESLVQLVFVFCDVLIDSIGDSGSQKKAENCLFALRMALARLVVVVQQKRFETNRRSVPQRASATAGVTHAFHPDMVLGKKKYSRAV
ncbi:MAG: hypothetical protein LBJ11_05625 [Oscillospiraceae bacterium]|nr:hypothetical protein [Oscillospiraceae bacterium]